jgi:type I restriction enzyme R subunit
MLDTGIDVPEVVNLVFFKLVRSKTKFWQMLGRGTRLCPDLFAPGEDKEFFYVFDYCQNLEYFSQDIPGTEGAAVASLTKRLFDLRLELIAALDHGAQNDLAHTLKEAMADYLGPKTGAEVRHAIADQLRREVAAMNLDNFVVRPHRRLVEKYAKQEVWQSRAGDAMAELSHQVAGLPTELDPENEEAKRFDLLSLNLQLALLRADPGFPGMRDRVKEIAALLEEKEAIPLVREQMALIQALQTDEWWQDVTVPLLEVMRRRLRELVQFIDRHQRKIVYTDFEDERGGDSHIDLPGFAVGTDEAKFRAKAQAFLRRHLDHAAVKKLRANQPLTALDLRALEQLLVEGGVGSEDEIHRAAADAQGLGLLVRFLVGMDRSAAKTALGNFAGGKTLTSSQIEFVNLIIDHLAEHGFVEPVTLYESPFTDITPHGPDALFEPAELDELLRNLELVRASAMVTASAMAT